MKRKLTYTFIVECEDSHDPDLAQVEAMIDLSMQDLVYDDEFIEALGERKSVTIQVIPGV